MANDDDERTAILESRRVDLGLKVVTEIGLDVLNDGLGLLVTVFDKRPNGTHGKRQYAVRISESDRINLHDLFRSTTPAKANDHDDTRPQSVPNPPVANDLADSSGDPRPDGAGDESGNGL